MLMVVALHVTGWGGMREVFSPLVLKTELVWLIDAACWCAVNCFAITSGYVGINSKYKYSNIIHLWIQVLFYSVLAGGLYVGITLAQGGSISVRTLLTAVFPFLLEEYWYFTAYVLLFFFMPLLNYIIHNAPRKLLRNTAIAAGILLCCVSLVRGTYTSVNRGYSVLWLAMMYLCGGYMAKYNSFSKLTAGKSFLCYMGCVVLAFGSRICLALVSSLVLGRYYSINFFIEYQSPFIVGAAVFLFHAFKQMTVPNGAKAWIRVLAPAAFGVYLIHENPIVRSWLITDRFVEYMYQPAYLMLALFVATVVVIFVGCLAIDLVRIQLFRVLRVKQLSEKMERGFSACFVGLKKVVRWDSDDEESSKS